MRISQNRPLKKFTHFYLMFYALHAWGDKKLCNTNLCDWGLTHIIRIKKTRT